MKLPFKVLSVTATATEEVVRLVPVVPDRKAPPEAVEVRRGSSVDIIIRDAAQWGKHRPDMVVLLEVTTP